jgi:hypothetical protein
MATKPNAVAELSSSTLVPSGSRPEGSEIGGAADVLV